MSDPVSGKQYTVQAGDTLWNISARAYGNPYLWTRIYEANKFSISDPDMIMPDLLIYIPAISELESIRLESDRIIDRNASPDKFLLIIEGKEIPVISAKIMRTLNTCADGWSAKVAWTPGDDPELDKILKAFTYGSAKVYIGGELIINGYLYQINSEFTTAGRIIDMSGWSMTADLVDSTMPPPYEANSITLEQRTLDLIRPMGMDAQFDVDTGGIFDRVTASSSDTIFKHLLDLASQRGLLISCTPEGKILFTRAVETGQTMGTLYEGDGIVENWRGSFDGRKRFHTYTATADTPGSSNQSATVIDGNVPRTRSLVFKADDVTEGNIQQSAIWKRSKALADALSISLPVTGWLAPNGKRWEVNQLITVKSATLFLPDGFDYLISAVEFSLESRRSATLTLVPPQVYSMKEITDPWK